MRGPFARPEAFQSGLGEGVDDANDQRRLGADDSQVDGPFAREGDQLGHILGTDRYVLELGFARRAGIAGRDENGVYLGRLRGLPGQRVFAAAAADDQYLHATRLSMLPLSEPTF